MFCDDLLRHKILLCETYIFYVTETLNYKSLLVQHLSHLSSTFVSLGSTFVSLSGSATTLQAIRVNGYTINRKSPKQVLKKKKLKRARGIERNFKIYTRSNMTQFLKRRQQKFNNQTFELYRVNNSIFLATGFIQALLNRQVLTRYARS